jgi:hypothetical protein
MPLGEFEREVLRLLAANRSPDSFIAGASVLNQAAASPRSSLDIDIFHDAEESLAASVACDLTTLRNAGFLVEEGRQMPTFFRGHVSREAAETKLEWVVDSAFRFFPVEADVEMGWRLNFWDAATNKVLAFAGRHVFRDYVDALYLDREHLALGALAWAGAGKDPGLTPEFIIDWMRRTSRYTAQEIALARLPQAPDLRAMKQQLLEASLRADELFRKLPPSEMGCLYLDATGTVVCPDPDSAEFARLTRHFGSVKGAWPRIAEE